MTTEVSPPQISLTALFLKFLRFGFLAFGGPVAQIAMVRQALVEEERWISPARFNRLLAVMQVLPGPEAHELCVHLGMTARGRIGGLLAGFGFMLPGFALMLALVYVSLQVRRFYHGPVLSRGITSDAEQYTYSLAWLGFGVILLGVGVMFNSQRARLASAVVIALTIVKAFLIDMSVLTGVYRALSFMCLGLVLVAIGWLYQRILFSRRTQPVAAGAPGMDGT